MRLPKYRLHKATGQAVVTIRQKDYYLGKYESEESREKYQRLISQFLAAGNVIQPVGRLHTITVAEGIELFWDGHVKPKRNKRDVGHFKLALRPLNKHFGESLLKEFGPVKYRMVRQQYITNGWNVTHINHQAGRLKQMLRWLVGEELYPVEQLHAIREVPDITDYEAQPRQATKPISEAGFRRTIPELPWPIQGAVLFQFWTGCRPNEALTAKRSHIDTDGKVLMPDGTTKVLCGVWVYTPTSHKLSHKKKHRFVLIGPRGQDELSPWMDREADDYLFSPQDSTVRGKPGLCYKITSYNHAIRKAVQRINVAITQRNVGQKVKESLVPHWYPYQLRHTFADLAKAQCGQEAAKELLGHSSLDMTETYIGRDLDRAAEAIRKIG